ncbi:MAG TPA: sigma-70 family RNA polymerase sigma factor [Planctomycetaceae bacterium]|nr:sigma-70 family RNA polymerase sigma factor [Planctomycetaceae bacterium]
MATDRPTDAELVERWRAGDETAASELHERYIDRLITLIGRHIARKFQGRFDADDVAQSVFGSFFRRTREGHFAFDNDEAFWKLLLTIGLNKVRKRICFNEADKRDPARELRPADSDEVQGFLADCLCRDPSVVELATFADLLETIVRELEPAERSVIALRIEGHSQQEIAHTLGLGERTVRRLFARIRDRAAEVLREDE